MYLTTPDNVVLAAIPGGKAGVMDTLRAMRRMVLAAKGDFSIRRKAEQIVSHIGPKDWAGEVRAIHDYVRDRITYRLDPVDAEMVRTPAKVLEDGVGDCDDKATLAAALLRSIGHPARFVAVGFAPGELTHVFTESLIGNHWFALETTEPVQFGWRVPGVIEQEIVNI